MCRYPDIVREKYLVPALRKLEARGMQRSTRQQAGTEREQTAEVALTLEQLAAHEKEQKEVERRMVKEAEERERKEVGGADKMAGRDEGGEQSIDEQDQIAALEEKIRKLKAKQAQDGTASNTDVNSTEQRRDRGIATVVQRPTTDFETRRKRPRKRNTSFIHDYSDKEVLENSARPNAHVSQTDRSGAHMPAREGNYKRDLYPYRTLSSYCPV